MVPPVSVEVSLNATVVPLVVYVKFARGVPPWALTVIDAVLVLVAPLALSVTFSVTL